MSADDFRRLALALPEAEEKSHFGKADYRVRNKIFATSPGDGTAVLKLSPEQQEILVSAASELLSPVAGAWGRQGWTRIDLAAADEAALRSALRTAWQNVAPKSLKAKA